MKRRLAVATLVIALGINVSGCAEMALYYAATELAGVATEAVSPRPTTPTDTAEM